jgi:hypothetical protein
VNTKVKTCPTIDERPRDKEECQQPGADKDTEEHRYTERIASMSREEPETAATVVINNIDNRTYLRVMRGTPTTDQWFDYRIVDSAGKYNAKSSGANNQQNFHDRVVISEHKVEQRHIEWHPRQSRRQRVHQRIEIKRLTTVNGQEQLSIQFYE